MKKLINSLTILMLAIAGMTTFSSCDPCTTVVCPANSVCKTGSCSCNTGYEKIGANCSAMNVRYGSGTISMQELAVMGSLTLYNSSFNYSVTAVSGNLYSFTLNDFTGNTDNDISFTISETNPDVIVAANVVTSAGYSYAISGSKTGSQVQLQLVRAATGVTYTLTYTL